MKPYPPRPEHCLSFYARDPEQVQYQTSGTKAGNLGAVLFGQQTEVTKRFVSNDFLLIQVVFKPGALFRITGIPSDCLTNQYLDAETIFSKEIKNVNEKINDCHSFPAMIAVVDRFLLTMIKKKSLDAHPIDSATMALFGKETVSTVDDLARHSFLSPRQFERIFKKRMGVSPKYYLKVLRFENAFRLKNSKPDLDWLSIAIQTGYHDYQHLVKDYKSLTDHTPAQFHYIDMHGPERLFGEADTY